MKSDTGGESFVVHSFHVGEKYELGHLFFEWLSSVVGGRVDEATHAKKYKQKIVSKINIYNMK